MGRDSSDSEEYSPATSISSDDESSATSSSEPEVSTEDDDGERFYSRKGGTAKRAKTRAGTTSNSNTNQYEPPTPSCCPASFKNEERWVFPDGRRAGAQLERARASWWWARDYA